MSSTLRFIVPKADSEASIGDPCGERELPPLGSQGRGCSPPAGLGSVLESLPPQGPCPSIVAWAAVVPASQPCCCCRWRRMATGTPEGGVGGPCHDPSPGSLSTDSVLPPPCLVPFLALISFCPLFVLVPGERLLEPKRVVAPLSVGKFCLILSSSLFPPRTRQSSCLAIACDSDCADAPRSPTEHDGYPPKTYTHTSAAACLDAFAVASRHHESRLLRPAAAADGHPPAERPAASRDDSPDHPPASTNTRADDHPRPPRPQRRPLPAPRRDARTTKPLRPPPPPRWPQHGVRVHWRGLAAPRDVWCRVALRDGRGQQRRGVLSQRPGDMHRGHLYRLRGWKQRAAERCEPLRLHVPGRQRVLPKLFRRRHVHVWMRDGEQSGDDRPGLGDAR